jgi:hypothetical protein
MGLSTRLMRRGMCFLFLGQKIRLERVRVCTSPSRVTSISALRL